MQCSVEQFVSKFPDAQFIGGDVILHVVSKNVVAGKLLAGEVVSLTAEGEALYAAQPEKKRGKKADEPVKELEL